MRKRLIVTGMIGILSFSLLTGAFAKDAEPVQTKETIKAEVTTDSSLGGPGKSNETFRGMWEAMKESKFGKDMFKAMEKQDFDAMRDLMQDPAAQEEMNKLMQDPAVQEFHDEMHRNNPDMQSMHNQMQSDTGGMMGAGSSMMGSGTGMGL